MSQLSLFKITEKINKDISVCKKECLIKPIFKDQFEKNDDFLNNQIHQISESNHLKNINNFKNTEIPTNQSNSEELKTDEKNNLEIHEIEIDISNESKKSQSQLGRKKARNGSEGKHNKFSDDNLRRKIKHIILSNIMDFINEKIYIMYNGNIGQGINTKKLLTLNHIQKSNVIVQYNKEFLNKTLGDIFSENISTRFTNFPKEHNKNLIENLKSELDESKRNYFNKLFNLTFLQGLKHFRESETINELIGLKKFNELIKKFEFDEDYTKCLDYYIHNFETIINNKKSRNKKKKIEENNLEKMEIKP